MYPHEERYYAPRRSSSPTILLLVFVAVLTYFLIQSNKDPVVVQPVRPTSYAVPTTVFVQPVFIQPVVQPTTDPYIQVTVDAYYAQPPVILATPAVENRGGWEAPTPEGEKGVHNPGRTDKRRSLPED